MSRSRIGAVVRDEVAAKASNAVERSSRRGQIFAHSRKSRPSIGAILLGNHNILTRFIPDYAAMACVIAAIGMIFVQIPVRLTERRQNTRAYSAS